VSAYVLPLRWTEAGPIEELASYLREVAAEVGEVLVVDGSPPDLFERHANALAGVARHLRPHRDLGFPMGKVNGVITGIRECASESIVIADDDVRYDPSSLRRTLALLAEADLVRPQNYFDELPWHARWDSARTLLNRVFTGDPAFPVGDFPGTLAVGRDAFLDSGAYDGNALFENLELMRTIRAAGGTVISPLDLYVARRPPSARHFLSQRVRQAYDDLAVPIRFAAFLALAPMAAELLRRDRVRWLGAAALASVAVAEIGRRRAGGRRYFSPTGSLLAPVWIAERSLCCWVALAERRAGGVRYGDRRMRYAATSLRRLKRRYSAAPTGGSSASGRPLSARNPIAL
jgi:glycosyl transferase family 2